MNLFFAELIFNKSKARLKVTEILLTLRIAGFGVIRFFNIRISFDK